MSEAASPCVRPPATVVKETSTGSGVLWVAIKAGTANTVTTSSGSSASIDDVVTAASVTVSSVSATPNAVPVTCPAARPNLIVVVFGESSAVIVLLPSTYLRTRGKPEIHQNGKKK